jgi:hypothetical protein
MKKLYTIFLTLILTLSLSGQVHPGVVASKPTGAAFCAEYQTIYNAFAVKPAADTAAAQNTFVKTCVDGDAWGNYLAIFYGFAQGKQANALVNWINPGTYNATNAHSTVFTAYEGFTGDATSDHIDTNFNPYLDSVKYKKNSACIGAYTRLDINLNQAVMGAVNTNYTYFAPRYLGDIYAMVNNTSAGSKTVANSLGMTIICRPNSSTLSFFRNGTDLGDVTKASTGIPNAKIYILDRNGDARVSANQVSCAFAGLNLTNAKISTITTAWETYMDFLGKGVF